MLRSCIWIFYLQVTIYTHTTYWDQCFFFSYIYLVYIWLLTDDNEMCNSSDFIIIAAQHKEALGGRLTTDMWKHQWKLPLINSRGFKYAWFLCIWEFVNTSLVGVVIYMLSTQTPFLVSITISYYYLWTYLVENGEFLLERWHGNARISRIIC